MQKIKDFWMHSYHTDKVAFYFEVISFIFTVGASATLALTAMNPDMRIVYPFFFIGSLTGLYGYYRRHLAWPMALTAWFVFVNILGFSRAMEWI